MPPLCRAPYLAIAVVTTATALKLSESISRRAMNLSQQYYVADTQENGYSSIELFIEVSVLHNRFSHSLTLHIQYKMYCCTRQRKTFIYSLGQLLCTLISRAASKPYLIATTMVEKVDNYL